MQKRGVTCRITALLFVLIFVPGCIAACPDADGVGDRDGNLRPRFLMPTHRKTLPVDARRGGGTGGNSSDDTDEDGSGPSAGRCEVGFVYSSPCFEQMQIRRHAAWFFLLCFETQVEDCTVN